MRSVPSRLLCSLALTLAAGAALAEDNRPDWPRFRGPNLDNHSPDKGLLKEWPSDGPPLAWKATGLGSGFASVTVAGDRVYTLGNKGPRTLLFALDRDSGKQAWSAEVGRSGGNLGCTPTVDGDRVYAVGQEGDLVCVGTGGDLKWKKNFLKDFGGSCGGWKYTESPLVDGDKLVCTPGGPKAILVALDKKTGDVIWKTPAPEGAESTAGYSSAVIAEVGGLRQYVQLTACGVIGVAAKDGRLLWHYDKFERNTANIPTPIVLGDRIFCAAGYGRGGALLELKVDGGDATARQVYFNQKLSNKHGGLVVVGDHVYGDRDDSGLPFCAEVKTGKVVWEKRERGPGSGSAAVTYADGHLYFVWENGVAGLVEATPKEYREVSTFRIPRPQGQSWAHPVAIGGRLYLRQGDTLYCHDVRGR